MTATTHMDDGENYQHRGMVPEELWNRLTRRVMKDESVLQNEAEQIMDAALGFLERCANTPQEKHVPSPREDIGWHTFLLYTRDYAAFCTRIRGDFIHHVPTDGDKQATGDCKCSIPENCSCGACDNPRTAVDRKSVV